MKKDDREGYWFPAKRYGWGWGPPNTRQGWAVLMGYIVFIAAAGLLFAPHRYPVIFAALVFVLTAALITVCFLKGEPPGWRWGSGEKLP